MRPSSTKFRMAAKLGVDEKDLYVEFFGLNHLSWIRSVKIKDEEILPRLLADDAFLKSIQEFSMFDPDLLRMIGFCRMNISTTIIIGKKRSPIS